eukprot:gene4353-7709_t
MSGNGSSTKLNEHQKQAIMTKEPVSVIFAGPGTGKTTVITHRIKFILDEFKVKPTEIVALTFSRRAKEEMSERTQKVCNVKNIQISTFHSICHQLLKNHGSKIGIKKFNICKDVEQRDILRKIIEEEQIEETTSGDCIKKISEAKNKRQTPQMIKESKACGSVDMYRYYSQYLKVLKEKNMLDYDDLLVKCLDLLDNEECLQEISSKIKYLLVDEFQDTNNLQYDLCLKLTSVHNRIMVVGDPEQTIFTWRYANVRNLQKFVKNFPNVKKIYLKINYRSTQTILRASSKLMKPLRDKDEDRELTSIKGEGDKIVVKECFSMDQELEYISGKIQSLKKERNLKYGDFAILCRTNSIIKEFEEYFHKKEIPYRVVAQSSFFDTSEVQGVLNYLKFVQTQEFQYFAATINFPNRRIDAEVIETVYQNYEKTSIINILKKEKFDEENQLGIQNYVQIVNRITEMNNDGDSIGNIVKHLIEKLTAYLHRNFKVYFNQKWEDLNELYETAKKIELDSTKSPIETFIDYVESLLDRASSINTNDSIRISTLHRSKGLEWPIVFIPCIEEGILPSFLAQSDEEKKEERRLFFVGMTRAKELLFLSHSAKRSFGERICAQEKSGFLFDLTKSSSNDLEIIPLEKKFKDLKKEGNKFLETKYEDLESDDESDSLKDENESFDSLFPNKLNLYPLDSQYDFDDQCMIETPSPDKHSNKRNAEEFAGFETASEFLKKSKIK